MNLLYEIQREILVLMSQGLRPRRVRVPTARRLELERLMQRTQVVRIRGEMPLHIMGVVICFEGGYVEID